MARVNSHAGSSEPITEEVALATSLGIDGTPTFVVNGVEVVGAAPESDLRAA